MIALRPFDATDADWVVRRHAEHYAADEGYDDSFADLVAQILADFVATRRAGVDEGWIALQNDTRREDTRLGCVFVVREDDATARLRLFLIEPEARGTGLAQKMMEAALDFARGAGYARMILWTHESHAAAGRLYARNGFVLERSWPEHTFGQDVISQVWARDL